MALASGVSSSTGKTDVAANGTAGSPFAMLASMSASSGFSEASRMMRSPRIGCRQSDKQEIELREKGAIRGHGWRLVDAFGRELLGCLQRLHAHLVGRVEERLVDDLRGRLVRDQLIKEFFLSDEVPERGFRRRCRRLVRLDQPVELLRPLPREQH